MANYSYSYPYGTYGAPTYAHPGYGNTAPASTYTGLQSPRRASTQKEIRRIEEADIAIGRVFWLPPQEELPARAVRRAHGKGAVEEGIYNHPIVVVSRPAEEPQVVHFHIVSLLRRHSSKPYCTHRFSRSPPSRANVYTRYIPRTMSSTLHDARGTSLYRHPQLTRTPLPRRCKSGFLHWTYSTAQPCAGTRMSTFVMSTK